MIPADHPLRRINVFTTAVLADLDQQLKGFYSDLGLDPELMIRILLEGYCYGIRHEAKGVAFGEAATLGADSSVSAAL